MKKLLTASLAILLTGLLIAPVLAAGTTTQGDTTPQVATPAEESKVPQAQIDYWKKREAFRQKRDEMMKLRQQNVNNGGAATTQEVNSQTTQGQ